MMAARLSRAFSLSKALSVINEKSLKILARLMYGHESEMYTPEQVLRDYESDYQREEKSAEIVSDYAEEMFSLLCEVMSELEGSREHSQLCRDVNDMVNTISREQIKYM